MRRRIGDRIAFGILSLLVAGCSGTRPEPTAKHAGPSRDALWHLVDECLNTDNQTCACPALLRTCCGDPDSPAQDAIWELSPDFVVIRNMRACGCGPDFVWGLAMPRVRVAGVEDPRRSDGIWPFAWHAAVERIGNESQIALVLNPASRRSQDQLHIHLLRLNDEGLAFVSKPPQSGSALHVVPLKRLQDAFTVAIQAVGEHALHHTTILVTRARSGDGWTMLLFADGSPKPYTVRSCDPV